MRMWSHACVVCLLMLATYANSQQVTAPPQYNGEKGSKGQAGFIGFPGDQGTQGTKGVQGDIGATGSFGLDGAKGAAGQDVPSSGSPGSTGTTGANGHSGSTGGTGYAGLRGFPGDQGGEGLRGERGVNGVTGPKGNNGIAGVKGLTGVQGDSGIWGAQGTAGLSGTPGFRGTTGTNGDIGYPFEYDANEYSDGCLELEGHAAKNCGRSHYCQDVVNAGTGTVKGECSCLHGYEGGACSSILSPSAGRKCQINNGGCQQLCTGTGCQCRSGFTLKSSGQCVDINECLTGQHQCASDFTCLNTMGSYSCLLDPESISTEESVQGVGLVNEQALLALLIWFLILFVILIAILIGLCYLKPVKTAAPKQLVSRTVEYVGPR